MHQHSMRLIEPMWLTNDKKADWKKWHLRTDEYFQSHAPHDRFRKFGVSGALEAIIPQQQNTHSTLNLFVFKFGIKNKSKKLK